MSIITRMLKQTGVYWAPSDLDVYGKPTWDAPVEISVRWEDVVVEFMDPEGEIKLSTARVYVSQDVLVKGVLLLSSLTSSVDEDDPKANEGAYEIRRSEKLPNLRATEFLRTTYL